LTAARTIARTYSSSTNKEQLKKDPTFIARLVNLDKLHEKTGPFLEKMGTLIQR
jgi:hypothetical protein